LPDLGLKNYDQRYKSYTDELAKDLRKQLHLQCFYDFPDEIHCNNSDKNPDGGCPFDEVIHFKQKNSEKDNVDDIDNPEAE
jgi:hypothetical protein